MYWAPMFLTRAAAKGHCGITEGNEEVSNNDEVLDFCADAYKIKLKQPNKTDYYELMALISRAKIAFMLVRKSHTNGLLN